ncbi:hypothetical protein GCM10007159_11510 [Modicisalibacter luteus]|nr:hypothetical protein GCM10007159_11510 [Halomonas lutea]
MRAILGFGLESFLYVPVYAGNVLSTINFLRDLPVFDEVATTTGQIHAAALASKGEIS